MRFDFWGVSMEASFIFGNTNISRLFDFLIIVGVIDAFDYELSIVIIVGQSTADQIKDGF